MGREGLKTKFFIILWFVKITRKLLIFDLRFMLRELFLSKYFDCKSGALVNLKMPKIFLSARTFSLNSIIIFSKFWHDVRNSYEVVWSYTVPEGWAKIPSTNQITGLLNEQNDEVTYFFYNFMKIKRWLKLFWLSMVKNVCDHSDCETLKLALKFYFKNELME